MAFIRPHLLLSIELDSAICSWKNLLGCMGVWLIIACVSAEMSGEPVTWKLFNRFKSLFDRFWLHLFSFDAKLQRSLFHNVVNRIRREAQLVCLLELFVVHCFGYCVTSVFLCFASTPQRRQHAWLTRGISSLRSKRQCWRTVWEACLHSFGLKLLSLFWWSCTASESRYFNAGCCFVILADGQCCFVVVSELWYVAEKYRVAQSLLAQLVSCNSTYFIISNVLRCSTKQCSRVKMMQKANVWFVLRNVCIV